MICRRRRLIASQSEKESVRGDGRCILGIRFLSRAFFLPWPVVLTEPLVDVFPPRQYFILTDAGKPVFTRHLVIVPADARPMTVVSTVDQLNMTQMTLHPPWASCKL
jgi:hypothetical protein